MRNEKLQERNSLNFQKARKIEDKYKYKLKINTIQIKQNVK